MGSWSYSETFGGGGWKGYDNYLAVKNQRINEQLKNQIEDTLLESGKKEMIFENCVFWLDGRTRIAEERLKELMVLYGGEYEASTLSRVTHIVADNLALGNQRWRQIRDKGSKQFSVVTSEWIVACVEKGSKIPESYFTPSCLKDTVSGFGSIFRFMSYASKDIGSLEATSEKKLHAEINHPMTDQLMLYDDFKNDGVTEKEMKSSFPALCTDECKDFVTKFFNASRLHFIGRWREKLALKFRFYPFVPLLPQWTTEKNHVSSKDSVLKRFVVSKNTERTQNVSKIPSTILHIDFDAFFVSVALKTHPHLLNRPVAVCHGTGSNSGSEIASCNYVARQFGVEKGMWLRSGKQLCPDLHVLPYDFQAIEQSSLCMMDVLTNVTSRVLPVSCDEAYLQLVGDYEMTYSQEIAAWIQQQILERTGCSVSIGIAPNLLLAKIATGCAKPKSSQQVTRQSIFQAKPPYKAFMSPVRLSSLPGIGQRAIEKLKTAELETCQDVIERCTLHDLQRLLGEKQGATCYSFCFGCDPRPFPPLAASTPDKNRSLTVSINWGIRLTTEKGVQNLLLQMSEECEKRLAAEELGTCDIILKILKRSPDAPFEPSKYGGCGMCDELSQASHDTSKLLVNAKDIYQCLYQLWTQPAISQNIDIPDLRGVTICMMKLQKKNQKKKESLQQSLQQFHKNMQINEKIDKESISVQNIALPLEHQVCDDKTTVVKQTFEPDFTPTSSINSDDWRMDSQPHIITESRCLQEPLERDLHDQKGFCEAAPEQQEIVSYQCQSSVLRLPSPNVCESALKPTQTECHENSNNQLKYDFFHKSHAFKKPQLCQVTPRKKLASSNKEGQKKIHKNKEPSQPSCMFDKKKKNLQPTLLQLMKKVPSSSSSLNNSHKRQESFLFASNIKKKQCNAIDIIDIDEISPHTSPHSPLPLCCQNDTIHSNEHVTSSQQVLPFNPNKINHFTVDKDFEKTPKQFYTSFTKSNTIQKKISDTNVYGESHTPKQLPKKNASPDINTPFLDLQSPSVPPTSDIQSPCVPPLSNEFTSDLFISERIHTNQQAPKQFSTIENIPKTEALEKKEEYQNKSSFGDITGTENTNFFNKAESSYVEQNLFDTIIQMKNSAKETEQHFVDVHVQLREDCISISDSSYSEVELSYCPNVVMVCILPMPTSYGQCDDKNKRQEKTSDSVDTSLPEFARLLRFEPEENSFTNENSEALLHHQHINEKISKVESLDCDNVSSVESADMLPFEPEENPFGNKNAEALLHHQRINEKISKIKSHECEDVSSLESADMLSFELEENSFVNENAEASLHHKHINEKITPVKNRNYGDVSSLESADMLPFEPKENSVGDENAKTFSHHQNINEKIAHINTPDSGCTSFVCPVERPRYQVMERLATDLVDETLPSTAYYVKQASSDKSSIMREGVSNSMHSCSISEISMSTKDLDGKDDTNDKTVSESALMERAVVGIVDTFGLCSAVEYRARMFQPNILDNLNEPRYTHCVCGGANETFSEIVLLEDSFNSPFSVYTSWLSKACWMCVAYTFVQRYTKCSEFTVNLLITQFGTTLIMICFLLSLASLSPDSLCIQSFPITFILEEIWGISTCFSLHRDNDIRNKFLLGLLSLTKNWNVFNDCVTSMISPNIHSSKHPLSQKVLKIWNFLQQVTVINSTTISKHALIGSFYQLHDCLKRMTHQDKCHFLSNL